MLARRFFRPFLAVCLAPGAFVALAQLPQPRLTARIVDAPRVVLRQSRTPQVNSAQDLGAMDAQTAIHGITLVFRRSAGQEAELQQLLAQQQTPGSPEYRHWLTPEAFAARFGMADADIQATVSWLRSHGFAVDRIARSRDRITFSGSASQVESAFGTPLHRYRAHGEVHFAPAGELTLPAQLHAITAAVLHLSDFRPLAPWAAAAHPRPHETDAGGAHTLVPADLATMYDFQAIGGAVTGVTQIAVVGQSYVNTGTPSAIDTFDFWASPNGPAVVLPILVPGSGVEAVSWGDQGESEIDLEYINVAGAVGNPFFVFVGDQQNYSVLDALAYSITEDVAPVISISYGICETLLSATELDQYNALFEQAAGQGQTIVASSGDSGSTACVPQPATSGLTTVEREAAAVNFPASSPYVTAVGGTQMAAGTFEPGNSAYWGPYNSVSTNKQGTLLSYVPEVVWNEGSAANGIVAGGGGSSAYYPRPPWQSAFPNMPAGSYRLLPDIALQASINSPGFVLCTSDPTILAAEGQTASCVETLTGSNNKLTVAGGTSFAAPIFAGLVALMNVAQHQSGLGNLNAQLYPLAATPATYAGAFHDITSGSIACVTGATGCGAASQGDFAAAPGYDEATGLGSIDVSALLAALPVSSTASLQPTAEVLIPSDYAPVAGEIFSLMVNVGSLSRGNAITTPTGTVSITLDDTTVATNLPLAPKAAVGDSSVSSGITAPTGVGYHLIRVVYSGDAAHAPSNTVYPLLIGSVVATGTVSLTAADLTLQANGFGTTQVTATPAAGYSGELLWSLQITGGSTTALNGCYNIAPLVVNGVSTTTLKLGIGTACNAAAPSRSGPMRLLHYDGRPKQKASLQPWELPAATGYAAVLLCGCFAGRSRRRAGSLFLILICGWMLLGLTACGGSGSSTNPATGSSTSGSTSSTGSTASTTTYTVALQGTDSVNLNIVSSGTFTLTVDQP